MSAKKSNIRGCILLLLALTIFISTLKSVLGIPTFTGGAPVLSCADDICALEQEITCDLPSISQSGIVKLYDSRLYTPIDLDTIGVTLRKLTCIDKNNNYICDNGDWPNGYGMFIWEDLGASSYTPPMYEYDPDLIPQELRTYECVAYADSWLPLVDYHACEDEMDECQNAKYGCELIALSDKDGCEDACRTARRSCRQTAASTKADCIEACDNDGACESGCETAYETDYQDCQDTYDSCIPGCSTTLESDLETCEDNYITCITPLCTVPDVDLTDPSNRRPTCCKEKISYPAEGTFISYSDLKEIPPYKLCEDGDLPDGSGYCPCNYVGTNDGYEVDDAETPCISAEQFGIDAFDLSCTPGSVESGQGQCTCTANSGMATNIEILVSHPNAMFGNPDGLTPSFSSYGSTTSSTLTVDVLQLTTLRRNPVHVTCIGKVRIPYKNMHINYYPIRESDYTYHYSLGYEPTRCSKEENDGTISSPPSGCNQPYETANGYPIICNEYPLLNDAGNCDICPDNDGDGHEGCGCNYVCDCDDDSSDDQDVCSNIVCCSSDADHPTNHWGLKSECTETGEDDCSIVCCAPDADHPSAYWGIKGCTEASDFSECGDGTPTVDGHKTKTGYACASLTYAECSFCINHGVERVCGLDAKCETYGKSADEMPSGFMEVEGKWVWNGLPDGTICDTNLLNLNRCVAYGESNWIDLGRIEDDISFPTKIDSKVKYSFIPGSANSRDAECGVKLGVTVTWWNYDTEEWETYEEEEYTVKCFPKKEDDLMNKSLWDGGLVFDRLIVTDLIHLEYEPALFTTGFALNKDIKNMILNPELKQLHFSDPDTSITPDPQDSGFTWQTACVPLDKCKNGFDDDGPEKILNILRKWNLTNETVSVEDSGGVLNQLGREHANVSLTDVDDPDCYNKTDPLTGQEYCLDSDNDGFCFNSRFFPDCDDNPSDDADQYFVDVDRIVGTSCEKLIESWGEERIRFADDNIVCCIFDTGAADFDPIYEWKMQSECVPSAQFPTAVVLSSGMCSNRFSSVICCKYDSLTYRWVPPSLCSLNEGKQQIDWFSSEIGKCGNKPNVNPPEKCHVIKQWKNYKKYTIGVDGKWKPERIYIGAENIHPFSIIRSSGSRITPSKGLASTCGIGVDTNCNRGGEAGYDHTHYGEGTSPFDNDLSTGVENINGDDFFCSQGSAWKVFGKEVINRVEKVVGELALAMGSPMGVTVVAFVLITVAAFPVSGPIFWGVVGAVSGGLATGYELEMAREAHVRGESYRTTEHLANAALALGGTALDIVGTPKQVAAGRKALKACEIRRPPTAACFLANTPILMSDGNYMNIEDVNVGDYVLAYDTYNNKLVNASVSATFVRSETMYGILGYEIIEDEE